MTIKRDINKLIPTRQRGKQRLAPLSGAQQIAAKRGVGLAGGAVLRTEARTLKSSDGIFELDYLHVLGITGP
jgi:hypothetical protein